MEKQISTQPNAMYPVIVTGDDILYSGSALLPELIQYLEKCKWNHGMKAVWINNILYVLEASGKGIILTPFTEYTSDKSCGLLVLKLKKEKMINAVSESEYLNFMLPYVGHANYGYFDLLVAQAVRFLTKKKLWIGSKNDPLTHHFTCGEFCAFVNNHFNLDLFTNWNEIAPSDLFDASQGNNAVYDSYVLQ